MTPKEILIAARARIKQGWCKGRGRDGKKVCAVIALDVPFSGPRHVAIMALRKQLPRQRRTWGLANYNDLPTTTKQDVLALYDRAIAGLI